jgi:DNA-binding GntR family transcriptional regulator
MGAEKNALLQRSHTQETTLMVEYPRELQKQFEQAIVEGGYSVGELVAARDLAHQFQVPHEQMRQVLLAAWRKGLVEAVEAKGDDFRVLGLVKTDMESVFTHTAKAGFKPTSLVRTVEVEPATPEVAEKLAVKVGSPVYRYVRTRNVERQALANQTNYIPFEVCPGLEQDDVFRFSFQRLLETKYYAVLSEMQEWFRLAPATSEDREILDLPRGSSVLIIERIALGATGWPLVWANLRIHPERYEYVSALWPQAAHLLKDRDL